MKDACVRARAAVQSAAERERLPAREAVGRRDRTCLDGSAAVDRAIACTAGTKVVIVNEPPVIVVVPV